MGCCGSRETHDEDDVHAPLLGDDMPTDSRVNHPTYETIDIKKEQEFWNEVIDRTTQNLIDIGSSHADPLQERDVQERVDKYRDLLDQIDDAKPARTSILAMHSFSPTDVLIDAKPNGGLCESEADWLYHTMDDLHDALQRIQVSPVGDMVIHLAKS